jgi:N-methylhydantoinase A/acetophenone carboxylase
MGNIISLDIGGTFTDCFILTGDGRMVIGKHSTTPSNIDVCFMGALEAARREMGVPMKELVRNTDLISYSTTMPVNALIQRTGPKLGLIASAGFEDMLDIGRGRAYGDGLPLMETKLMTTCHKPVPLIDRNRIVGVNERIDALGEVVIPLVEDEVREKVQHLMNLDVSGIVVSLLNSYINPAHEKMVSRIISDIYPNTFLGNLPVLLSSDAFPVYEEYLRTNVAVLNAYMHVELADQLHRIGEELRRYGYNKPLLIVKNIGGMGSINRTPAIEVYNSGPVSGLYGSGNIGELYDQKQIVMSDMGGTSFDIGVIVDGQVKFYDAFPTIDRFRVGMPIIEVRSVGAGGGSIASINSLGLLQVGPKSAGSVPGPVCYDQGGTEPAVTDADLILGYINPDRFAYGKKKLNKEKAYRAIKEKIADKLGLSVEEAAWSIKKIIDSYMQDEIYSDLTLKGHDPREFDLYAFGGAGVTHCCGYSETLGIKRVFTFPFSPVFCAFGSCNMDIVHKYERTVSVHILSPYDQTYLTDYAKINNIVNELKDQAVADMEWEGFNEKEVSYTLELQLRYGTQYTSTRMEAPKLVVNSEQDVKDIINRFSVVYAERYGADAASTVGGIEIVRIRLITYKKQPHVVFPIFKNTGEDSRHALSGKRDAYWGSGYVPTNVYDYTKLKCGNVVQGPAIIEHDVTTYVIPEGKKMFLDKYMNGQIINSDAKLTDLD